MLLLPLWWDVQLQLRVLRPRRGRAKPAESTTATEATAQQPRRQVLALHKNSAIIYFYNLMKKSTISLLQETRASDMRLHSLS